MEKNGHLEAEPSDPDAAGPWSQQGPGAGMPGVVRKPCNSREVCSALGHVTNCVLKANPRPYV